MTYFCRIYENLWDFIEGKRPSFKSLKPVFWPSTSRPSQRSVDRCAQTCTALFGWRAGRRTRSIARELCSLNLTGRSTGIELLLFVSRPWSTGRSTDGQKSDRWPVNRAVDRQQEFLLSCPQWLVFGAYLYGAIFYRIFSGFSS